MSEDATLATDRIGRLQRQILQLLGESPRGIDSLHAELPAYRRDNVSRAVSLLRRKGRIVDTGNDMLARLEQAPAAPAAPQRKRGSVPRHEYTALAAAFLLLSQGAHRTGDELFPPHAVSRDFASRATDALERLRLIERAPNGCYAIMDAKLFQDTWADERLFRAALGWGCETEEAYSMSLLLGGNGSLREDAAAAAVLYECIGQENVARRTGLPVPTVTALRRIAALAPGTQEAIALAGLPARWILGIPSGTPEESILAAITSEPHERSQGTPAEASRPDELAGMLELPNAELLANCFKLCAFTADTVAKMERQLAFLASELGYRERE